jgi:hypothetical protein
MIAPSFLLPDIRNVLPIDCSNLILDLVGDAIIKYFKLGIFIPTLKTCVVATNIYFSSGFCITRFLHSSLISAFILPEINVILSGLISVFFIIRSFKN